MKKSSSVYILKCENYYKIGKASNLKKRIKELQTGNPFEITPIYFSKVNDATRIESILHEVFNSKRKSGEWFNLTDDDITKAKNLINRAQQQ